MANNTTLNPGAGGDVIATEEISGVKHQLVKMQFGGAGAATKVSSADPLPVVLGAGGNIIGLVVQSGTWNITINTALPAGTNIVGGAFLAGRTSGGDLVHRRVSSADANATSVKGTAGQVYFAFVTNTNAAWRYLHLYDKATAPTVGTDVPILTIPIPPGGGAHPKFDRGIPCASGIAFAITTSPDHTVSTGVSANEHVVNLGYQ